ncbi:sce7726 family protein [Marinococcus sp. PL1-022]|uniref:sce7726 family protein n=1 Tax=Marinococcus sp. PL1-022 TaxID=3095363 RepID=UPI0029C4403C|nr:sce7726 family protein [Marinococcus sp. PL1-022]MDX6153716.1 sce7726 family protein [Marinococcus sp. PL1-022]
MDDVLAYNEVLDSRHDFPSIARTLYSNYHTFMQDVNVWELLENVLPKEYYQSIEHLKEDTLGHQIINDFVMRHYPGEQKLKYELTKRYINRDSEISAYEINVNKSRLDVGRINGKSYAYEIKTELDSLEKLEKQVSDYSEVFEYTYVVVHPCHFKKVMNIVPEHCGVITYREVSGDFKFSFRKRVDKSPYLNKSSMLRNLNSKELDYILKSSKYEGSLPVERDDKHEILLKLSDQKINALFKRALKQRYNKQWGNLCQNFGKVYPIDVQAVFKSGISPELIYFKNSSNVLR